MLTAKQLKFCEIYAATGNGAKAYRGAYNVLPTAKTDTCAKNAGKLLADPEVIARIDALRDEAAEQPGGAVYDARWCMDRWARIAQADPRELIGLRVGCCRHCWGVSHRRQWDMVEYLEACDEVEAFNANRKPGVEAQDMPEPAGGVDFDRTRDPNPDCPRCRGEGVERFVPRDTSKLSADALLLYGGVKVKRDGYEVIIADRTKALENVTRMAGGYKDNVRLDGSLSGMLAVAKMENLDPQEATRMYQALMASPAVRAT